MKKAFFERLQHLCETLKIGHPQSGAIIVHLNAILEAREKEGHEFAAALTLVRQHLEQKLNQQQKEGLFLGKHEQFVQGLLAIQEEIIAEQHGLPPEIIRQFSRQSLPDGKETANMLENAMQSKTMVGGKKIVDRLCMVYATQDPTLLFVAVLIRLALMIQPQCRVETLSVVKRLAKAIRGSRSLVEEIFPSARDCARIDRQTLTDMGINHQLTKYPELLAHAWQQPNQLFQQVVADLVGMQPSIPAFMICPISHAPMKAPVELQSVEDGARYAFDKACIETWLAHHNTNPLTNEHLPSAEARVLHDSPVAQAIQSYCATLKTCAATYFKEEKFAEAAQAYVQLFKLSPSNLTAANNAVVAMLRQDQFDKVIEFYENNSDTLKGETRQQRQLWAHCLAAQAYKAHPGAPQRALELINEACTTTREPEVAAKKWRKRYEALHGAVLATLSTRATTLYKNQKFEEAENLYVQIFASCPTNLTAANNAVLAMMKQNKFDAVIEFYEKHASSFIDENRQQRQLRAHHLAAQAYKAQQETPLEALKQINEAIDTTSEPALVAKKWRQCYITLSQHLTRKLSSVATSSSVSLFSSKQPAGIVFNPDYETKSGTCAVMVMAAP